MNKTMKIIPLLLIGLLILSIGCIGGNENGNNEENNEEGNQYQEELGISEEEVKNNVTIYWFWGEGCPYCKSQEEHLDRLDEIDEVEIKKINAWENIENKNLIQNMANAYGTEATGVPMTFIGEEHWAGFMENMHTEMQKTIASCLTSEDGCINPMDKMN